MYIYFILGLIFLLGNIPQLHASYSGSKHLLERDKQDEPPRKRLRLAIEDSDDDSVTLTDDYSTDTTTITTPQQSSTCTVTTTAEGAMAARANNFADVPSSGQIITHEIESYEHRRKARDITQVEWFEIEEKLKGGEKLSKISVEYKVSVSSLSQMESLKSIVNDKVAELKKQKKSPQEIADALGLNLNTIYDKLREKTKISKKQKLEIINKFNQGERLFDIADQFNITTRKLLFIGSLKTLVRGKISELAKNESNIAEIAKKIGLYRTTVDRILKQLYLESLNNPTSTGQETIQADPDEQPKKQLVDIKIRGINYLSKEEIFEIKQKISTGAKLTAVAKEYRISLYGMCHIQGIKPIIDGRIKELQDNGYDAPNIAELTGLGVSAIYKKLKVKKPPLSEEQKLEIIKNFNDGMLIPEIAEQYGIVKTQLCRESFFKKHLKNKIVSLDSEGESKRAIANSIGLTTSVIKKLLRKHKQSNHAILLEQEQEDEDKDL